MLLLLLPLLLLLLLLGVSALGEQGCCRRDTSPLWTLEAPVFHSSCLLWWPVIQPASDWQCPIDTAQSRSGECTSTIHSWEPGLRDLLPGKQGMLHLRGTLLPWVPGMWGLLLA